MLPSGLPERSLGWQALSWASRMLAQPDGKKAGDPFRFSPEQARFIVWFYAIDDEGRFLYRNAVLERPKGWGKSPLLAALSIIEFMGPCRFDHWENDKPVAIPMSSPLVQVAAISDSQAENTYSLCREMMANGPFRYNYPNAEILLSKSTHPGNRTLEKVTASPRGREGNRATFVVMDETHLWVPAEKGPELYDALARNCVKLDNRWVETTNAPVPGEGSVAEESHNAYEMQQAGKTLDRAILFDTREVFVEDIYDREKAMPALQTVYGDAAVPGTGWVNLDRIWAEINDPRTKEYTARRFYFNQRVVGHSGWLRAADWHKCKDDSLRLKKTDRIALGFKGKVRNGAVCLVAARLTDGALFELGWWETSDLVEEISYVKVDRRVRKVLDTYDCYKFLANPDGGFQDIIGKWALDYNIDQWGDEVKIIEENWLRIKNKQSKMVEQFEEAVYALRVQYADDKISKHILSCHLEEVPDGYILRRETKYSQRFIDGAQAAILAYEARTLAIEEGALEGRPDATLRSF